jgi:hypothetical protein
VALAVVVDAQIFRLEAVVRWLDAADTRLASRPLATPTAAPASPGASPAAPRAGGLPLRLARKLGVRP